MKYLKKNLAQPSFLVCTVTGTKLLKISLKFVVNMLTTELSRTLIFFVIKHKVVIKIQKKLVEHESENFYVKDFFMYEGLI